MNLTTGDAFDALQQALVAELLRTIKRELEGTGAPSDRVEELTGKIAFAVSSLIDDVAGFDADGREVTPMLTFQVDDQTLVWAGGNSWMHEYVYRLLPSILDETRGNGA